jgi:LPXTG-motif cell wall-anchored protein
MLLGPRYQGNGWWIIIGLISLLILSHVLFAARRRRKAGLPVNVQGTIGACIFCLGFVALALFQVLSHRR